MTKIQVSNFPLQRTGLAMLAPAGDRGVEQTGSVLHGTRSPVPMLAAYPLLIESSIL